MRLAPLPTASVATLSARAGPALLGIGSDDGSGTSEAQCTVALVKNIVGTEYSRCQPASRGCRTTGSHRARRWLSAPC